MTDIVLDGLRKLISDIETGVFTGINGYLNECWKEFFRKQEDATVPLEILSKNREILEGLIIAVQAYEARHISEERLHLIKSKLLEEK